MRAFLPVEAFCLKIHTPRSVKLEVVKQTDRGELLALRPAADRVAFGAALAACAKIQATQFVLGSFPEPSKRCRPLVDAIATAGSAECRTAKCDGSRTLDDYPRVRRTAVT